MRLPSTQEQLEAHREDASVHGGGGGGPHAASHQDGGADELDLAGLSGLLADAQTPLAHSHTDLADVPAALITDTELATELGNYPDDTALLAHTGGLDGSASHVPAPGTDGHVLTLVTGARAWAAPAGGGGGAPTDAEYVVAVAHAGLSAERVLTGVAAQTNIDNATAAQSKVGIQPHLDAVDPHTQYALDSEFTDHVANDPHPTAGEDAALAGTSGVPSGTNKYVTDADTRNTNARTPTAHDILSAHNGFPGGTTNFLRADGAFAAPPGGGGGLTYQEADRATDLTLTTSYVAAVSLSLAAGTWLIFGQTSIESTSTTQGNVSARLRNTTDSVTYSIAEGEVDSALPDRCCLFVHATVVLAATKDVALEGRQSAGTSHMIGPGNLADAATVVTRMTAIKIA